MVGMARDEVAPCDWVARRNSASCRRCWTTLPREARRSWFAASPGSGVGPLSMCERAARERGMAVLSTTGVQSEANLPFAGLHPLIRPVRGRANELRDVPRAALDAALASADKARPASELPWLRLTWCRRLRLTHRFCWSSTDTQWLDPPTSDVLAFVARRIQSDPIVLLAGHSATATRRRSAMRGCRSFVSPVSTTRRRSLLDVSAPGLSLCHGPGCAGRQPGIRSALLELPAMSGERDEQRLPGGLPLSDRLERAFAARVSDLPDATRLVLIVAALNDSDGVE